MCDNFKNIKLDNLVRMWMCNSIKCLMRIFGVAPTRQELET